MTWYRKREVLLFNTFSRKCNTVLKNSMASQLRYSATADTMDFQPFVSQVISCLNNDFIVLKQAVSDCRSRVLLPLKKATCCCRRRNCPCCYCCCRRCCCPHSLPLSPLLLLLLLSFALFVPPGYKTFCVAVYTCQTLVIFSLFVASLTDYQQRFWHIRLRVVSQQLLFDHLPSVHSPQFVYSHALSHRISKRQLLPDWSLEERWSFQSVKNISVTNVSFCCLHKNNDRH